MVETNIGVINHRGRKARRVSTFTHLAGWSHEYEPGTQRRTGIILQLNDWMYQGIVEHRDVLKIPREYFDLTSGYARWLYRQSGSTPVRIPTKPATDSDRSQPPVPKQTSRAFR